MKLAVDRGLIGPAARVIVGLIAGAGIVLWSERFRKKGFAAFSYSLKALGSGVLYLALWAAFRLYDLIPAEIALAAMVLVTAWNAYMSWAQNSQLLAAYALAGGFATPILLSTGGNHEIFLFTYLLAIDVATIALVRLRPWPRLLLAAFPFTVAYFIGWYISFYTATELAVTSVFIALFVAAFGSVPLGIRAVQNSDEPAKVPPRRTGVLLEQILLPLANSGFAGLAFYSVLQDAGHHDWLPWLMLVLAAAYLVIMKLPQTAVASAMHLSIAVVFLTIAIPLKASGAWITVSWLVEGLALVWVATRLSAEGDEAYAAATLRWLGMASLGLGFAGTCVHVLGVIDTADLALWNKGTGTALTGVAVFAATAWLAFRKEHSAGEDAAGRDVWGTIAIVSCLFLAMTAGVLTLREIAWSWSVSLAHPAFQTADFAMAVLALAIFAGLIAASLRVAKARTGDQSWALLAAAGTIVFNFIAVLTGVREVSALFAPPPNAWTPDAALQQALAISAFLMLYGATLLAVGFWRRSAFLRWQGLALLLFTILKAFLYDMRNLSQGYRVVSLLGLGVLLLAVSFAYQKDWLNLRGNPRGPEEHAGGEGA
jgi:uncharacterized membrane protein